MAAAVVIGSVLYIGRFPLIIYFAAHHVFNEVYLTGEKLKGLNANQVRLYRATAIPLQPFLYFYLLRSELNIRYLQDSVLLAALVVAYVCYFMLLISLRKSNSRPQPVGARLV